MKFSKHPVGFFPVLTGWVGGCCDDSLEHVRARNIAWKTVPWQHLIPPKIYIEVKRINSEMKAPRNKAPIGDIENLRWVRYVLDQTIVSILHNVRSMFYQISPPKCHLLSILTFSLMYNFAFLHIHYPLEYSSSSYVSAAATSQVAGCQTWS